MDTSTLHKAAKYAEELGYGKGRFYAGIFGLIAVAIAFAATAVYAVVVGDVGAGTAAGVGSLLMLGVVIWRLQTWSRKFGSNE